MDIILVIIGIALIVAGNRNKNAEGKRTGNGQVMFIIGAITLITGAILFSIGFVTGFNKAINSTAKKTTNERQVNDTTTKTTEDSTMEPEDTSEPDDTTEPVESGNKYPAYVRTNFVNSCVNGAGGEKYRSYCECALENIEKIYTLDEYKEFERNQSANDPLPPEVQDAIDQCTK